MPELSRLVKSFGSKALPEPGRFVLVEVALLFAFFTSVYMLTYSGRLQYNDELQMMDTVGSLVEFHDQKYDIASWNQWVRYRQVDLDTPQLYPLVDSTIEPGFMLSGIPLYVVASVAPRLGLLHTLWLLNIFASAATGVVMYRYARLLGYSARVALWAALLLCFGTVLWPYSKTFMREPLTMFLLLSGAYWLECARVKARFKYYFGAAGALAFAFLTKESALMVFPGLAVIALPTVPRLLRNQKFTRSLDVALILLVVGVVIFSNTGIVTTVIPSPISITSRYALQSDTAREALHNYLFSVGGSLWGTSPALLLALPGAWLLIRRGQRRYVWVMALAVTGITLGHALSAGLNWFGGASWPPRFVIPVIPLVVACILPVLESVEARSVPLIAKAGIGAIILYSLWWQVSGVSIGWEEYPRTLPPESGELTTWLPSTTQLAYLRPLRITPLWFDKSWDLAWVRSQFHIWPVVAACAPVLCGIAWRRRQTWGRWRSVGGAVALLVLLIASQYWLLAILYERDPQVLARKESLHQISAILDAEEVPGDVVLLNNPSYYTFFANYRDFDTTRVVSLDWSPGERGSFEQTPRVISDDVHELVPKRLPELLDALAARRERIWLLMDTGPFVPWSIRPVEWFMAQHYYPLRELQSNPPDPTVRLLEYSTVAAPDPSTPPDVVTDMVFGESIHLIGVTLPESTTYAPGEILPITLYWQADAVNERDYTVAIFLADADDVVLVQGADSPPRGGFAPTSSWEVGASVRDNRALRLPEDSPSGAYRIWVRLYFWGENGIVHLPVRADTVMESTIGVLPPVITVE